MAWDQATVRMGGAGNGGCVVSGVFTADTGGVTKNDVCYISAANKLKPVASATQTVAGVAMNTAAAGAAVDLLVLGVATLTADGVVAAGDNLGPASTAGRAVALNSNTPTGTVAAPTFTGSASGTPSATTTVGSATHTHSTTPNTRATQCVATCNCNTSTAAPTAATSGAPSATTSVPTDTHTHVSAGSNSAPAFSGTASNTGLTYGRALTAAAGAGSTFTAFVNSGGGR